MYAIRKSPNNNIPQAIAAAAVMTDRACIASGSAGVRYSTEDVLSCCHTCGFGCGGGYPAMAFKFWKSNGKD